MHGLEGIASALIVAPHGDDEALGAGGLIYRLVQSGAAVHVVFLAVDGSEHYGIGHRTTLADRHQEIESAARFLGFTYQIAFDGLQKLERLDTVPLRDIVDVLQSEFDSRRPDLVLLPEGDDYDQDHRACYFAGLAATRPMPAWTGKHLSRFVLTYEMPKLTWARAFQPQVYFELSEDALNAKLHAVSLYLSQLRAAPHIRSLESLRALAQLRGSETGLAHAESFGVRRWLVPHR